MPYKICPQCLNKSGVRTHVCTACQYKFTSAIKKNKNEQEKKGRKRRRRIRKVKVAQVHWRDLQKGDIIKVVQGTGSYYISKKDEQEEKLYMGVLGKTVVCEVQHKGLLCYNKYGYAFVRMVDEGFDEVLGLYRKPHKIMRLKCQ